MREFKGFGDWVEIFRGGKQIDSMGREHDGDAIIERAAASFDAAKHEPPLVVGHPVDNAPAFGWVKGLKTTIKDGATVLLAKIRDVAPEFEDLVRRGLYKKRSASFYPDGGLRHVGFLGAAPPAVKGLADIGFNDGDGAVSFEEDLTFEISNFKRDPPGEKNKTDRTDGTNIRTCNNGGKAMSFKDKLKNMMNFMGVDMSKIPDDALPDSPPEGAEARTFSEADLEAAKRRAAEEAKTAERKKVELEFAERAREAAKSRRRDDIGAWCDTKLKDGKVLPAWAKMGLKEFMMGLDGESEIAFSETSKATSLEWFKNFMEELPKVVEFREIATRQGDTGAGSAGERLSAIVKKKVADNRGLEYGAAFAEAQIENPELAAEYKQEITG